MPESHRGERAFRNADVGLFFFYSAAARRFSLAFALARSLHTSTSTLFFFFTFFFSPPHRSLTASHFLTLDKKLTPPKQPQQEFKGSDFGWHKTKIAQMLTVKRERELAEGVSKRDSRAAEKRAKVEAGFGQF